MNYAALSYKDHPEKSASTIRSRLPRPTWTRPYAGINPDLKVDTIELWGHRNCPPSTGDKAAAR